MSKIKNGKPDKRNPKSNFSSPSSGPKDTKKWPEGIPPSTGTHKAQRGHDYVEQEVKDAVPNQRIKHVRKEQ